MPTEPNLRYEVDDKLPWSQSFGYGLQFSVIAMATLLVTPVIVANAADRGGEYVNWMVFASLVVVGLATLFQAQRLGPASAGLVLPMFTAAFSIPFCITALVDGGPATLTTLVMVAAVVQLVVSRWLFILRRFVTPTVGGTVMMILSITLASVVFDILNEGTSVDPERASLVVLVTVVVEAALILRGSLFLRFWGPLAGIVLGCITAGALGIFDTTRITEAAWIGLPNEAPGLALDFGVDFWTLVPAFLFLGVIISIQANGASIAAQRSSSREHRAVNFRQVQGAVAGTGLSNLLAGLAGTVPNAVNPAIISFTQITGVTARRMGYSIGIILLLVAFVPKVTALLSSIPGPVMAGYLVMVTGALFIDGARTVLQNETNESKIAVAGMCFWIAAAFQFELFALPDIGSVGNAMLKSGITTGGLAAIIMILYLELTNPRRMRFRSQLHIDALPELNQFISRFARNRGWDEGMQERLSAVAEETLLTLAPLDLSMEQGDGAGEERQLVVLASSDGPVADLEFIGGGNDGNLEDHIRQLQQLDTETPAEQELSLVLLQSYASSVKHQQYHDTDIITISVIPPEPQPESAGATPGGDAGEG